jgi:alpha-beta hydrolase superfamily lysophospholipase
VLVVLHGLGRNAAGYRDHARALADRHGLIVVAPLFDRARFPVWRYQLGGVARDGSGKTDLALQPRGAWLSATLDALVDLVREREANPGLPLLVVGHSAGGQALTRYALTTDRRPRLLIAANPSTWLWPDADRRFPYGFAALPSPPGGEAGLRRYLGLPLVVLLGTADTIEDPDLNRGPEAMRQGEHRYARGLAFYRAGEDLARERGWTFGWRLVEVPGVGHSARRMLGDPATLAAVDAALGVSRDASAAVAPAPAPPAAP